MEARYVSSMDEVRVKRDKLIEKLKANKAEHSKVFLIAQDGYREAMIKELDQMLSDARAGNKIRRAVSMPEPQDHTDDYDRAITMLEMCEDEHLMISAHDFQQFVMDEWGWKRDFIATSSNYTVR